MYRAWAIWSLLMGVFFSVGTYFYYREGNLVLTGFNGFAAVANLVLAPFMARHAAKTARRDTVSQ